MTVEDATLLKPLNVPVSEYHLLTLQMWRLKPREIQLLHRASQPATKPGHSLQGPDRVLLLLLKYSKRCQLPEPNSFLFF